MQPPAIRVVLGDPAEQPVELVVRPGRELVSHGRVVEVPAPRWTAPAGQEYLLAEAYRAAVAVANARLATSMALPGILARGPWPANDVIRVAMTVLRGSPTTLRQVVVAVTTAGMLELWAEAIVREGSSHW